MVCRKGFTLIEIMVVLIILGILVAVAAPMYFGNTDRARASEAVAGMGMVRQALRDYHASGGSYYDIANGNITNPLSPATNPGANVTFGVTQYFSSGAYSVDGTTPVSANFTNPGPVDFMVEVSGAAGAAGAAGNTVCAAGVTTDCAIKAGDVSTFRLQMDNSGRIYVSYDSGTTWSAW